MTAMYVININTFLIAFSLLAIMILLQIFIWRVFKPKKQISLLFKQFLVIPGLCLVVVFVTPSLHEYLPSLILFLALSVVYIQSFPGIQAISPSLEMIYAVKQKMSTGGATLEDIHGAILSEKLLTDRLEDLVKDGLAYQTGEGLKLKKSGLILAQIFYYYRRALGLPRGGG